MTAPPFRTTTRSIPPVPRQREKSPWPWIAYVTLVGMAIYGIARIDPQRTTVTIPAAQPPVTQIVEVRSVLEWPTEAPTATATITPTKAPTVAPKLNWCGEDDEPGTLCQRPPLPTATATAYPSCARADPGTWCLVETRVSR